MHRALKTACAFILAAAASGVVAAEDSVVVIENKSAWEIHELYLSPTDETSWGPDQFGDFVLEPGTSFELHSIECDKYDVKIVDEDGDACVVEKVRLCADDEVWTITDEALLACQNDTDDEEHEQ